MIFANKMKNSTPHISVIIPIFNAQEHLSECLDSVLTQTLGNIEVICINDGSTDDSLTILQKYAKKDNRIVMHTQKNSGVSVARNVGLDLAQGECVVFVDADDYIDRTMLSVLWDNYQKTNADIIVFGGQTFPIHIEWINRKMTTRNIIYQYDSFNALFYEFGSIPFMVNKLIKRSMLIKNNIHFSTNLALGEDQVFYFSLFPRARKIQYIDNKFYYYRVENKNSAMAKFNNKFKLKNNIHLQIVQTIIDEWQVQGYLSGNERHLMRWAIKFLKNCTIDTPKHSLYFCKRTVELLKQINYQPKQTDDFFKLYHRIFEIAKGGSQPKISVVVPVFNVEQVLPQCVESILNQTFKDFEVIFVDDGSEDNSLNILYHYEDMESRIQVLSQQNKYAGVARNRAMQIAQGDYLIFLDSDDFFEPNLLEEMYNSITREDCDICICGANSHNHISNEKKPIPSLCKTKFIPENIVFSKNSPEYHPYIYCFTTPAPWNKMFKRSFVQKNNLWFQNTRNSNDMFFSLMALSLAEKITINPKSLINYRINNSKSLQATKDSDFYSFYDALSKLKSGLIQRGIYEQVKDPFINFALDCCLYNLGTMKKQTTFLELYDFIKNKAFKELDINSKESDFFYGYSPDNGKKKELLSVLSAGEYIKKFNLIFK